MYKSKTPTITITYDSLYIGAILCRMGGVIHKIDPVEAFATAIKFFDRQKVCLIA